MKKLFVKMLAMACFALSAQIVWAETDTEQLFTQKCSICHKMEKEGMGPSVMDMNTDAAVLQSAIADGRNGMPAFEEKLGMEKINALVSYIQSKQVALNPCAKNLSGK